LLEKQEKNRLVVTKRAQIPTILQKAKNKPYKINLK
jgi:hypothetical protein